MKTLEEIRGIFEDKTFSGHKWSPLEMKGEEMVAAVRLSHAWVVIIYNLKGLPLTYHERPCNGVNLVPVKPKIDYSKLPADVLCLVSDDGNNWFKKYSNGSGKFYSEGQDSFSETFGPTYWKFVKIAFNTKRVNDENQIRDLPDNIKVRVWINRLESFHGVKQDFNGATDILWYQILAED